MKFFIRKSVFFALVCFFSFPLWGESVLDEETSSSGPSSSMGQNLATERVKKISESKKIFIITNDNHSYSKGDFITLIINDELVSRALCAKDIENVGGIKILKIYSEPLFHNLRVGSEVKILKGDDSYWKKSKNEKEKSEDQDEDDGKIKGEDDLYNDTKLEEDSTLDENKNRAIKTDNILSLNYSYIGAYDNAGNSLRVPQFAFAWAYQLSDNFWGEAAYGRNVLRDYPNPGIDTSLSSVTFRLKYAFQAPLYSYILPYVGYQLIMANSPGAGQIDPNATTPVDYQAEIARVDMLKKNRFIAGVTLLKRLVPGWFLRADAGLDQFSGGIALEF